MAGFQPLVDRNTTIPLIVKETYHRRHNHGRRIPSSRLAELPPTTDSRALKIPIAPLPAACRGSL